MLYVTKSFIPRIEEYNHYLLQAFEKGMLTNRGELVTSLEERLMEYLGVQHLTLTTNGTLPMQIAIKVLGLTGEIITTPFSYVATASCISWEGSKPIFADIDPIHWTLDPQKIEEKITSQTTAILATHIFGNPCDVESIEAIAKKHNLHIIYDAAHCFGVKYKGQSIFNYGDISTCSFHATKIFHTGEGGCFITKNEVLHRKLLLGHNFGHTGPTSISGVGINAKMSELQAAMGHAVLDNMSYIIEKRHEAYKVYMEELSSVQEVQVLNIRPETQWNFHYFPIVFTNEKVMFNVIENLNKENIFPRRYFYPSLNTLDYIEKQSCPISESISDRILCLPLSAEIEGENIVKISRIIRESI